LALANNEDDSDLWGVDSDDSGSDDEDCGINTRTELGQSTLSIIGILSDLFKLAFMIRNPTTRASGHASSKPLLFKKLVDVDGTAAVDAMACYAEFDRRYVEESFRELRRSVHGRPRSDMDALTGTVSKATSEMSSHQDQGLEAESGYLIDRWSKSLTNRRRYLAYWQNHAQKLAREDDDKAQLEVPDPKPLPLEAPAAPTLAGKTILSGTEASTYDRRLEDDMEALSLASYTSTAYGPDGAAAELPRPPPIGPDQTEFQCPYCCVACPARHASGKAWR
jgi:hypothetical protein